MEQLLKKYTMNLKARRFNDPSDIDSIAHYNKRYKLNQERENELEETGGLQDGLTNGINNLGLNSLNVRNTRFVINTTAVVPEHDFSEDSSDEEVDENFDRSFDECSCVKGDFPFTPITKTTSKVKTKDIILENELAPLDLRTNSQIVGVFLNKLLQNGFDEDEKNNKMSTIAVSVGLNRMYSVSSRKNKLLNLELQSAVSAQNLRYETFGFYWKCKWCDNDGKEVKFEDVRHFYKKLKKANPNLAKQFVIEEQAFARNRENIPYQDIREFAKNHKKTKKLITKFREDNANAIIYLSLIDADVLDFNEIYSAYLRIIDGCDLIPTIMTTGYEYPNESSAFELSSHMDRIIRVITASHIPLGTYYPEPNMCILVPQNCDTIPESFIDRKRGNGKTPEEQELIDIMRERSADFMKLPKGFLLRIVTSPLMPLIKNYTVDIVTLCKQDIEVLERFVDDNRISVALENKTVEFEDLINCLEQDISNIDNPIAALLMEVGEPMEIVRIYPEITEYALENGYINGADICSQDDIDPEILGYAFESGHIDNNDVCDMVYRNYGLLKCALENGYIDDDDVRAIRAEILGDRDDCAAAQEFDMYYIIATEGRDDYYDDDFDVYEDRAD